ncbi:putative lymphocyte cytosolic protein [Trypoxylus dichotomus]
MSQNALKEIESYDEVELKRLLQRHGMGPYLRILDLEKINGRAFLNLSKEDFLKWKKTIPQAEIQELRKIWKAIKENPERYVNRRLKTAIIHSSGSTNDEVDSITTAPIETVSTKSPKYFQELQTVLNKGATVSRKRNTYRVDVSEERQIINAEENNDARIHENTPPPIARSTLPPVLHRLNIAQKKEGSPTVFQQIPAVPESAEESRFCVNIDRRKAELLLESFAEDGAYLFRPSSQYRYALSMIYENKVRHLGVKLTENNKLEFVSTGEDRQFDSLEEIVEYFTKRPILQIAARKDIIRLTSCAMAK